MRIGIVSDAYVLFPSTVPGMGLKLQKGEGEIPPPLQGESRLTVPHAI